MSILITLAGLETATKEDLSLDRELQDAGLANMASGLLGGSIAYHAISNTLTNRRLGGRTRLVPFLASVPAFLFLAFGWGTAAIGYLPIALLSGLVLYVGLDAARTWLLSSRQRMTRIEYTLLIIIAACTLVWGPLVGVTVAVVIAILLFTLNYSQLPSIELRQTGKSLRSKVERPGTEEAILRRFDDDLKLFRLQGYLFFASAEEVGNTVMKELRQRTENATVPLTIILDFHAVSGVDSSATLAFARLIDTASAVGAKITFVRMSPSITSILSRSISSFDPDCDYPDTDVALEAREASLLARFEDQQPRRQTAADTLRPYLADDEDIKALLAFFNIQTVAKGEILFKAGEPANSMMIVDAGEFEVYRQGYGVETIRLRKVLAGTILGEMGIYLRGHRTASVRAVADSRVLVLDDTTLSLMHEAAPDLALKFNRFIIGILAERLSHSNNEVLELSSR